MTHEIYVLDTYALLALLEDEPGAQTVAAILAASKDRQRVFISIINLGETYYILLRRKGQDAADEFAHEAFADEALTVVDLTWERVRKAAEIKSKGGLSYADSFVLALAAEVQGSVVTGDPEIKTAAERLGISVTWIGPNRSS
jgi:predicted nucleic acid-binding protein